MRGNSTIGVIASLTASVLFGGISLLAGMLTGLTAEQVTAWRVVWVVLVVALAFTLTRTWDEVGVILRRLAARPALIAVLLGCAGMMALQLWVFMWGPMHGHALDVSLGYFLMPLVVVGIGRLVFHDELDGWQIAAIVLATVGVIADVIATRSLAWPTALVGLGYPAYFAVRRWFRLDGIAVFWLEVLLLLPAGAALTAQRPVLAVLAAVGTPEWWAFVGLGVLSGVAMLSYILASGRLTLTLFGLLSYLEPVLVLLAALVLGERPAPTQLLVFAPIVVALALLAVSGVRTHRRLATVHVPAADEVPGMQPVTAPIMVVDPRPRTGAITLSEPGRARSGADGGLAAAER